MIKGINLHIVTPELMDQFKNNFDSSLQERFNALRDSELSIESFSFYTSVSAVFSSKIEGENIDLDSFIKHKRFGTKYQPDYTRKIDDLYDAYLFAQKNKLNQKNLEQAHQLLTSYILQKSNQGKIRKGNMFVVTKDGKIEYVACSPDKLATELKKFYLDLEALISADLSFDEVFYFASLLHLVFVKIHPFEDGNGRASRLLEKWFLAEKLGAKAWFVQTEKHYYDQHQSYYHNIRLLGLEYDELNYTKALPFLQMLPQSLNQ